jgi:hypothetical protein
MVLMSLGTCLLGAFLATLCLGRLESKAKEPRREYFYVGGEYTNITVSSSTRGLYES